MREATKPNGSYHSTNSRGQTATEGTWAERTSQIRLAGPLRKEVLSLPATADEWRGLRVVGDGLNLLQRLAPGDHTRTWKVVRDGGSSFLRLEFLRMKSLF